MISRKKKSDYGRIVNCKEANVLDNPEDGAPLVCQLKAGDVVKILSKPNRNYYSIGVSNSVIGFVSKDCIEAE